MNFMHHVLRTIWANLFGFFVNIKYIFQYLFSKNIRERYKQNKELWDGINSMEELVEFIQQVYVYKYDGPKGIFDHNNFKLEWFVNFGDCDDVANWVCKKIKQIYPNIKECDVYGFADLKALFWHYDVVYKMDDNDSYHLFNYGRLNVITENPGNSMVKIYHKSYKLSNEKMKYWKCKWM